MTLFVSDEIRDVDRLHHVRVADAERVRLQTDLLVKF